MTRAFITGVSGQDGSYLAEELLHDGYEVHGLTSGQGPNLVPDGVVTHEGDLRDAGAISRIVGDVAPDQIYHLAAVSSVARSWEEPLLTTEVNCLGSMALLDAAWRLQESSGRPVTLVQAASAEIFGEPDETPQTERTPIHPENPYGATKAFVHQMVNVYRLRGLHACSAILYNHESPRRPTQFVTRKITSAVAAIAQGRQDKLALGNLDARRDWGWAPDYVHAMRLAAEHTEPSDYLIATGEAHSVREFVQAAFAHVRIPDWENHVEVDPRFFRPVDATELRGDASKARRELGWAPTVTFEEIVARMVEVDLT